VKVADLAVLDLEDDLLRAGAAGLVCVLHRCRSFLMLNSEPIITDVIFLGKYEL
jgi:hypothetical protein